MKIRPGHPRAPMWLLPLAFVSSSLVMSAGASGSADPARVLNQLTLAPIASFPGSGTNTIQAMVSDADGNIYVAGTTSSFDFPATNAFQPQIGESRIMRSLDRGTTWSKLSNTPTDALAIEPDPVNPKVLFAGGTGGIYKSTDGGASWRTVYTLSSIYGGPFRLLIDPGNPLRLVANISNAGLLVSVDGGETWTVSPAKCFSSLCVVAPLAVDPSGSGEFIVSGTGTYISKDWGQTFIPVSPPRSGMIQAAAFDPFHKGAIYVAAGFGTQGQLFFTPDNGATWTQKPPVSVASPVIGSLMFDPEQANTLYAATHDGFFRSTDGASTWTLVASYNGPNGVNPDPRIAFLRRACGPGGALFAVSEGSTVLSSLDFGATWQPPQLSVVRDLATGPGCAVYAARGITSDGFIVKLAPDGTPMWSTFLGGSNQDAVTALALDSQGNVYAAGYTYSPDFPSTAPAIGATGQSNIFVTKFDPGGSLLHSVTVGGVSYGANVSLAVDSNGNAYIVGGSASDNLPVTPGAFDTTAFSGGGNGFIVKLASDASLAYASYLGIQNNSISPAVVVDSAGQAIIAGSGIIPGHPPPAGQEIGYLIRLDASGSQLTYATYIGRNQTTAYEGVKALAIDAQGNVYATGDTAAPDFPVTNGAYVSAVRSTACMFIDRLNPFGGPSDIYIVKLNAIDLQPVYSALLAGKCGSRPAGLQVDRQGNVTFAAAAGIGFPLRTPLLAGPTCAMEFPDAAVVGRLSADGSTLQFSTYLDSCGAPPLALAPDGSVYVGSGATPGGSIEAVQHLSIAANLTTAIDRIANSFSGDASGVVPGGLFSITGVNLGPEFTDLGLNAQQPLPPELSGVQVTFDGVSAPIFEVSPSRVIVVAPTSLPKFTSIQVAYNGALSNAVSMPVETASPALLTRDFPDLPDYADFGDGNV
ncbi:MAG: SBBP repeat-containing protein, partial [Bryobacteraceae bacterium]